MPLLLSPYGYSTYRGKLMAIARSIRFLRRGKVVELDRRAAHGARCSTICGWRRRRRGTKEGCDEGDCGACTVALGRLRDGRVVYEPVNACILLLGQIDGKEVVTVEDLA